MTFNDVRIVCMNFRYFLRHLNNPKFSYIYEHRLHIIAHIYTFIKK